MSLCCVRARMHERGLMLFTARAAPQFSDIDPDIRHVAILDATKYAQENSHKWSADECGR